jgi:hypothetical protein
MGKGGNIVIIMLSTSLFFTYIFSDIVCGGGDGKLKKLRGEGAEWVIIEEVFNIKKKKK